MPQVLKESVRTSIVDAAERELAERGFTETTVAAIARRAGISTGNVYRYYPSKKALFEAVVTPELADTFERLLEGRVRALRGISDVDTLERDAAFFRAADELFRFTLANRLRVVVLLGRSADTTYEDFGDRMVGLMVELALDHRRSLGYGSPPASLEPLLQRIYGSYLDNLVDLLASHDDEAELEEALDLYSSYHLAGLKRLFEHT